MRISTRFFSIVFLGLFLFVMGCTGSDARPSRVRDSGQLQETQKFVLNDLTGRSVALDDLLKKNKAVLINFWATWCPPCREEIPGLIDLQKKFSGRSFTILGVDAGESQVKVSAFAERAGINYPVVLDSDMAVSGRYSVYGIPTSFLISSTGKILGEYHAYTPELIEDVQKALAS
ncbi:MAG: hypothetical protein COT00_00735 [Candidatus Omnitrophica bacterium CG07_land_8_20_14_0_80_50_8]|nr:MAG: hypothetical protein AUJ71_01510 [Candidatus Omnitrophica bacterium CG1_02_49_16]PIU40618.1 MAG: hypothetical protein COT00_00735 [Candidatus Omnitrophica bacterium CG07_land_8_20_14_0_80_50_8]